MIVIIYCSISADAKDFFSIPCVQTSSEAHPASYPMATGGPFPLSSAEVKNELELYLSASALRVRDSFTYPIYSAIYLCKIKFVFAVITV
jgi:hypothetical protein